VFWMVSFPFFSVFSLRKTLQPFPALRCPAPPPTTSIRWFKQVGIRHNGIYFRTAPIGGSVRQSTSGTNPRRVTVPPRTLDRLHVTYRVKNRFAV